MSGVHSVEYVWGACEAMGGGSKLVVYWTCYQVPFFPLLPNATVIDILSRIATDLNLYTVKTSRSKNVMNEMQEREALNRTRTWLICFNLDRSIATQFGKRPTIIDD